MKLPLKVFQPDGILAKESGAVLYENISATVTREPTTVLVDMQRVVFIDSAGLETLLSALKAVRSIGEKLYLCSLSPQVKLLFELTNIDKIFEIYPNRMSLD